VLLVAIFRTRFFGVMKNEKYSPEKLDGTGQFAISRI
jgi:hypothetical protein